MPETPNQHPGVRVAFEDELCAGATMKCLDARMMQIYVHMASNDALTPEELLRRKGYLVGDTLTKGGVLLFAKDPSAAFAPIARLEDELPLARWDAENVMPYGVAMLLAQSEGDADGQALFAAIYNRKRAAVGGFTETRRDVLPR